MLLLILLGLTLFLQLFTVSLYLLNEWSKGKQKAIPYKLLCCLLFLADVLLGAEIRNAFHTRAFLFLFGALLCCTAGDVLLNLNKKWAFPAGIGCFTGGQVLYTYLFSAVLAERFSVPVLNAVDLAVWAALLLGFTALTFWKKKFEFRGLRPAVIFYAAVIFAMSVKALHLGIVLQTSGVPDNQSLSFGLVLGALGFLWSDALLFLMYFGNKNTRRNCLINAYAYFFAQMFLACTILYFGG